MSRDEDAPRAWYDVNTVKEAARVKQKAVGYGVAEENARRKQIAAQRALRLARDAAEPAPEPAKSVRKTAKAKARPAGG